MTQAQYQLAKWLGITLIVSVAVIILTALMGNTPVTWAIACGQNSPTCATSDASYSRGNTTCHCEKAP